MEITVLLVDDHPLFRRGIRDLLEEEGDMRIAGEAGDGQTAIELVRELNPDVVIMDITMPKLSGVEATRQILAEAPDAKIIALSIHGEKQFIEDMFQAGAAGYLLKDSIPEELVNGIRAVMRGEVVLSAEVAGVVVSEYRKALSGEQALGDRADRPATSLITHTKLHRPQQPLDLVHRPHLLALLEQGLQRPLTLISAAAGFGKTTLLAAWLESVGRRTPPVPGAWLQLDEEASDLVVFTNYFLAAIQTVYPDVGSEPLALLQAASRPPVPVLARSLLNELDQIGEPFVLVLDDCHKIQDEAVHELLAAFIQHLPPQMHLAIASRTEPPFPLTSLRARGQVLEIRTGELRFSSEETHSFLVGMTGQELSRETAELLRRKTEGWIVGLRMAALSMRGRADVVGYVQRFEGSSSAYVADYLMDEVLDRQRSDVQEFMLRISILDRFCAGLCDAVLDDTLAPRGTPQSSEGHAGGPQTTDEGRKTKDEGPWPDEDERSSFVLGRSSRSQALLDKLNRANLFLVPLDHEGIWYRFHNLFKDLLRHRLESLYDTTELAALHARASAWFVEQGLVDEALDHALAAGDVAGAAQIVAQNRKVVLVDDKWTLLVRWLDRLPAEIKQQRPELLLAQAWVLFHRHDFQSLPPILEEVERILGRDGATHPLRGEIDFLQGHFSYFAARGPQAEKYLASATEGIPETYHRIWGEAELHYAFALHMNGRVEMALDRLNGLIHSQRLRKGIDRTRLWSGLYWVHLLDGSLPEAVYPARKIREIASIDKNRYAETWGFYMEACAHFQWNDLEGAVQGFNQLAAHRYFVHARAAIDGLCALSLAYQHLQRPDQADETVKLVLEFAGQMNDPAYGTIAASLQARLCLLRGDTAAAVQWLRTADLTTDAGIMFSWLEVPRLTECRVLIAEGSEASLQQAVDKLEQYDQQNEAVHNTCQRITILPLLALATHKQGRTDDALAILGRAVALAVTGGFIRPFADLGSEMAALLQELVTRGIADGSMGAATVRYLNQIFAAFPEPVPGHPDAALARAPGTAVGLIEPLTGREMEVLALLAQRLSNQELARELVITVGTVKQHTNSIYGKLGVGDRRMAVARARSLGLLPAMPI